MYYMLRCCPLVAIVPIALFLTASFFVLFTLGKVTEKWLKVFGYVTVGFLLVSVLVVFSGAVSNLSKGSFEARCMMQQGMKKGGMMQMMKQKNMQDMPMMGSDAAPRE
ncbi:MAG: hypothetical protein PHT50_05375 [Candidatus Omnitrophica bacterium]|nr:hypothetical protein [Candidatus Omnitrophota bacterium]